MKSRAVKSDPVQEPPKAPPTLVIDDWENDGPPPEFLLEKALQEPSIIDVRQYLDSIRVLRNKGYSFREIAEWLNKAGVDTNHNTVYRVYTQSMSSQELHEFEKAEEEEAMWDAMEDN